MALVNGVPKGQQGLAKRWYDIVRLHLGGQLVSLVYMARASSAAGVCFGGAAFMAANVLFFVLGAGRAKHDAVGLPAPIKPSLMKFVLTTDAVLLSAALLGAVGLTPGAYVFGAGCLIGAAEGAPKSFAALKKLATL